MDLDEQHEELKSYFGEKNLVIEYFNEEELNVEELDPMEILKKMFINVKITHLPSGKVVTGTKSEKQIENAIKAMLELKALLFEN
nr:peptide chain release factor-like protein [Allomuricauda sp.]